MWLLDFFGSFYESMYVPVDVQEKERQLMSINSAREHSLLVEKFTEAICSIEQSAKQFEQQRIAEQQRLQSLNQHMAEYEFKMAKLREQESSKVIDREIDILESDYQVACQEFNCKKETAKFIGRMLHISLHRLELLKKELTVVGINESRNELIKCGPLVNEMVSSMERTIKEQQQMINAGVYTHINMTGDVVTADSVKTLLY